ncbi:MAG: HAD-IB family hydrolase [Planctomycetes bacterium]|nr:HAD-IB family hydrolase [Planctomycetota bacterium]
MMSDNAPADTRAAAFFDVDGTLVRTTIVHYYIYFRRRRMSPLAGAIWQGIYLLKCVYFLVLDKISRSRLNIVFYRGYAGLPAGEIKAQAEECHREVIGRRCFEQAPECIREHRDAGHAVVLVTGSIDFIVEPLARQLRVTGVIAPALVESNGRFTGQLDGPPIGEQEKARRIVQYAREHGIDLAQSHAYGDSIADLPMLEAVGHAHAVNPDRALATAAKRRGWQIHRWTVPATPQEEGS